MRATIVVPCFNEAERLKVDSFLDFLDGHHEVEFLFVNDGSNDGTLRLLEDGKRQNPDRMEVISLERNSGKAEAVRIGMLAAMQNGAHYAGYWDADLATPLEAIMEFASALDRNPTTTLVMGSRVRLLGRSIDRTTLRHFLGRGFASAVSWVLRLKVYDTQCGAKLFRVRPEIKSIFLKQFCSRWIFDVELLARMVALSKRGLLPSSELTICEWPLQKWADVAGSKLRPFDFVLAFYELATIFMKYRLLREQRPEWAGREDRGSVVPFPIVPAVSSSVAQPRKAA